MNDAADDHRRDELDDLIWKAQELVRNLDTLSIASEVGEEEPEPELKGEPTTIADLDRAIALSADRELQMTVAATVDAVLDQVFEERAAIVQNLDAPAAPIIEEAAPKSEPAPAVAPQDSTPVASPVIETPVAAIEQRPVSEAASPSAIPIPEPPVVQMPLSAVTKEDSGKASSMPLPTDSPVKIKTRSLLKSRAAKVAKPVVPVLMIVNFPLRWVPSSLRPLVDWAALSLLVWVPIIWIMVVTLGKKPQDSGAHVEPTAPATHAASSGH